MFALTDYIVIFKQQIVHRRMDPSETLSGSNLDLSPGQNIVETSPEQIQSAFDACLSVHWPFISFKDSIACNVWDWLLNALTNAL